MKREELTRGLIFVSLVAIAVIVRLVSETPNFNAVTAAALFAGFFFRSRLTAIAVPLLSMVIADQFLGGYETPVMIAVYASLCIPVAFRSLLRSGLSPLSVGGTAVCSTVAAYLVSNFAVWYVWYPQTWEGFTRCYVKALPFLANAMTSDLLFSATFFGLYAVAALLRTQPAGRLAEAN